MAFYEKHWFRNSRSALVHSSRPVVCMILAFATVVMAVVIIVALILPQLVSCVRILIAELPGAMDAGLAFVESLNILPEDILRALDAIAERSANKLPPPTMNFVGIVGKEPYPVARKAGELLRHLVLRGVERLKNRNPAKRRHNLPLSDYKDRLHNTLPNPYLASQ